MITPDIQTTAVASDFGDHVLFVAEPTPRICGDNGHFGVSDGVSTWLVIVTEEALAVTASGTEASLERLNRFINIYRRIAETALALHEDVNGSIWIFEKDVRAFARVTLSEVYSVAGNRTTA